jgi:Bacterial membrane protein YfhO
MLYQSVLKSAYQYILRHHKNLTIYFIFAVFFVLFFHKGIITGTFYTTGDQFIEFHPLRRVAWDMIRQGSLPLWTPYMFSGYPLFAESHMGLAYPLNWGYLFLPSQWVEQINVLAPFLLAPLFTYFYIRALGKSRLAGILAGLCFGYGGFMASRMANGLMPSAVMWLPLVIIPILKVSGSRFIPCLLWAFAAYLMSVLNGTGQGFLWVGIMALAYGFYLSAVETLSVYRSSDNRRPADLLRCWKPLAVAGGAVILVAGLASFQIFESWAAKTHSIRNLLDTERFNDLTYSPTHAWRAFLAPIYNRIESTPFVTPGAAVLALLGVIAAFRKTMRDRHLFFWLIAAIVSGLLMLGSHTPVYGLLYYIPIVNSFRGPSRHSFEWTFALSVLAAYGWDMVTSYVNPRRENVRLNIALITSIAILVLTIIVGCLWVSSTPIRNFRMDGDITIPLSRYLVWKAVFTSLSLIGLWFSLRVAPPRLRTVGLCAWIAVASFFEPYIDQARWWGKYTLTADRMTRISPVQRWLQQYPPEENRVYTRVKLLDVEFNPEPLDIDSPNNTVLAGLHNVAGYEPLILQRYSRALGDVGMDGVSKRGTFATNDVPLDGKSHVLDLLNTRFLVVYSTLSIEREPLDERNGIGFSYQDLPADLLKEGELNFDGITFEGDKLALVSMLVDSVETEDRTAVARAEIHTADGQIITRDIFAGIDTSEWAYERDDVRPFIRHSRATIFDSSPNNQWKPYLAHRYVAAISLGGKYVINHVSIKKAPNTAQLKVWKASLHNSDTKKSVALNMADQAEKLSKTNKMNELLPPGRWKEVHRTSDTIVFRNERALPRAWLVGDVRAVGAEEALKTISGESGGDFDPRRTALVETGGESPQLLSQLSGGQVSPDAVARISSYEPSRLRIDTEAEHPSFLVLSEIQYPGWTAQVDGVETPIYQTNYLLRGVALPAGKHTVVMKYTAPAFRKGVYVSGFTLVVVTAIAVYGYVSAKLRAPSKEPAIASETA